MAVDVQALLPKGQPYHLEHLKTYLESGGKEGHIVDRTHLAGSPHTTTLILKTLGRKTGKVMLAPLIYANFGPEDVIVASKGGAPDHPGWFKNLIARPEVEYQVGEKTYRGTWRVAEGAERRRLWDYVSVYFPPYKDYAAKTEREIPVVVLTPVEEIGPLYPA